MRFLLEKFNTTLGDFVSNLYCSLAVNTDLTHENFSNGIVEIKKSLHKESVTQA